MLIYYPFLSLGLNLILCIELYTCTTIVKPVADGFAALHSPISIETPMFRCPLSMNYPKSYLKILPRPTAFDLLCNQLHQRYALGKTS
ncbi:hypothetical protein F4678DRAFT_421330 [Xylaria arbuscula]|nr:hypothetical protein F4678DRAFT_421330 [Xylaria arbuscula]